MLRRFHAFSRITATATVLALGGIASVSVLPAEASTTGWVATSSVDLGSCGATSTIHTSTGDVYIQTCINKVGGDPWSVTFRDYAVFTSHATSAVSIHVPTSAIDATPGGIQPVDPGTCGTRAISFRQSLTCPSAPATYSSVLGDYISAQAYATQEVNGSSFSTESAVWYS